MSQNASVIPDTSPAEAAFPLNGKLQDGSIVNVRTAANEEHYAFLAGRFKCLGNPNGRSFHGGNLLEGDGYASAIRVFRVSDDGLQRLLGNWGDFCISVANPSDANCGNKVLAIEHGVVKKVLDAGIGIGNGETLQHVYLPESFVVCEGQATALAIGNRMLTVKEVA